MLHNLNHRWAYVIVSSMVTDNLLPGGKNEEATIKMVKSFTAAIAPEIMPAEVPDGKTKP